MRYGGMRGGKDRERKVKKEARRQIAQQIDLYIDRQIEVCPFMFSFMQL